MSIPKTIHYIWFGGNPLGDREIACIDSWKKHLPDYEIVRWDESNFDIEQNRYCREAYECKKWAFVSDYARLWILVNHGGIYMDTDVEVRKPLDRFLDEEAFSGFETDTTIPTGIMACRKGFPLFEELLHDYDDRSFFLPSGALDLSTNVVAITNACLKRGFQPNNTYQCIAGFALYPKDFFCPKSYETGIITETGNTYTIHHFNGSWITDELRELNDIARQIKQRHRTWPARMVRLTARVKYGLRHKDFKLLANSLTDYLAKRKMERGGKA